MRQDDDCDPPGPFGIRSMIHASGLHSQDDSYSAIGLIAQIEGPSLLLRIARNLPNLLLKMFSPAYPTMIFLLRHPATTADSTIREAP